MFEDKLYLMDGATGTALQAQGMPAGAFTGRWVLEHPEALLALQKGYAEAGCRLICAPTQGLNSWNLERFGITGSLDGMGRQLVELTRQAAGGRALVLGDMGATGLRPAPYGETDEYELLGLYTEHARALENADIDIFFLESQCWLCEAKAALEAIRAVSDRPVIVSLRCGESGRTNDGVSMADAVEELSGWGLAAFGINDMGDRDLNLRLLRELRENTDLPLLVKPSAGTAKLCGTALVYGQSPEEMERDAAQYLAAGVHLIGGCSGTDRSHIEAIARAIRHS